MRPASLLKSNILSVLKLRKCSKKVLSNPSEGPWACQPVVAPQPDGPLHIASTMCLNHRAVKDSYTLPGCYETDVPSRLVSLSSDSTLVVLGIDKAKLHLKTRVNSLRDPYGPIPHIGMTSGLCNVPLTDQRHMDTSLEHHKRQGQYHIY